MYIYKLTFTKNIEFPIAELIIIYLFRYVSHIQKIMLLLGADLHTNIIILSGTIV